MMDRYIYKYWGGLRCTNIIVKGDLARVKAGEYDFLIDTENGTYFDADNNTWEKIEAAK